MAAVLVDFPLAQAPAPGAPRRWVHLDAPRQARTRPAAPAVRPTAPARPGGRPQGVGAPSANPGGVASVSGGTAPGRVPATAPLQLTRRGLAVVMGGFAVLMLTALVVMVTTFLAVPNEPVLAQLPLG
ncbi:MAG: hypothetical protein VB036_16685 [Propionicimonas sp.]|nr:hypothetical protein [Propionicimonas sp.]